MPARNPTRNKKLPLLQSISPSNLVPQNHIRLLTNGPKELCELRTKYLFCLYNDGADEEQSTLEELLGSDLNTLTSASIIEPKVTSDGQIKYTLSNESVSLIHCFGQIHRDNNLNIVRSWYQLREEPFDQKVGEAFAVSRPIDPSFFFTVPCELDQIKLMKEVSEFVEARTPAQRVTP